MPKRNNQIEGIQNQKPKKTKQKSPFIIDGNSLNPRTRSVPSAAASSPTHEGTEHSRALGSFFRFGFLAFFGGKEQKKTKIQTNALVRRATKSTSICLVTCTQQTVGSGHSEFPNFLNTWLCMVNPLIYRVFLWLFSHLHQNHQVFLLSLAASQRILSTLKATKTSHE